MWKFNVLQRYMPQAWVSYPNWSGWQLLLIVQVNSAGCCSSLQCAFKTLGEKKCYAFKAQQVSVYVHSWRHLQCPSCKHAQRRDSFFRLKIRPTINSRFSLQSVPWDLLGGTSASSEGQRIFTETMSNEICTWHSVFLWMICDLTKINIRP